MDYDGQGLQALTKWKNAMRTRIPFPYLILFLCLGLLSWTGCGPSSPSDRAAATEKVLKEIHGTLEPEKPLEALALPGASVPSVSKQSDKSQTQVANSAESELAKPSKPKTRPSVSTDNPSTKWIKTVKLPRDLWEVQYLGNAPVGFSHKTVAVQSVDSTKYRHELDSRIRVLVKNVPQEQRIRITTVELGNGELERIEGELTVGPVKRTFEGKVRREVLSFTGEENGQRIDLQLEWKKEYRGPFAVEQSMLRKPLEPGELRRLTYLDPLQLFDPDPSRRKLIDGELDALDYIYTPTMNAGSQELLEVRCTGSIGGAISKSLLWVDKKGEGQKSLIQKNDILSFRSEPIAGQIFEACSNLRALPAVSIPLSGDIQTYAGNSSNQDSVTFRIKHKKNADPFQIIKDHIGQEVKSKDPSTVDVTVYRKSRELDEILALNSAASNPNYLANSEFVPKDKATIQKLGKALIAADKSLSSDSSNREKAIACQRVIQKKVKLKDYDILIRPAPFVAKSGIGNCAEHATLLTSVCRSLDIPARIAMGVKFNGSKESPAMNFHTWVEILDGQKWIPIDSSQEELAASMDRVKIRDTDFNAANPYLEILEVYTLLPDLEIEVRPLQSKIN